VSSAIDGLAGELAGGPTKGSGRYSTTLTLKLQKAFAFSISHTGVTAWPHSATPALEGARGDVHVLADVEGRTASVVLLDGPDPGLLRVVLVCHVGVFWCFWVGL